MTDTSLRERGAATRRKVLGGDYVASATVDADAFDAPLQALVDEYCWGWAWTREGLPHKTRSLLNLAMLSVLNRPNQFKVHVAGALRNGCTVQEIQETLLQVAIYGGIPCGVEAFKNAKDVIEQVVVE